MAVYTNGFRPGGSGLHGDEHGEGVNRPMTKEVLARLASKGRFASSLVVPSQLSECDEGEQLLWTPSIEEATGLFI